ncbi:MAG: hypothetical protein Q8M56_02155, partial [Desulfobacterales bacterium]|nr:hypothetical protein [Desulfobacterales bacterium]
RFLVHSYWFLVKREKPETTNQRSEAKVLNKSGQRGCYAKRFRCTASLVAVSDFHHTAGKKRDR